MQISSDERFRCSLEYLAHKFHQPLHKIDGRYTLTLPASTDKYQYQDAIVYQVTTAMKKQYLQDNLKIKDLTLIKVLVNYDRKTDIIIATALINVTPIILFDAIYNFGIAKLKCRWDEIIGLVNDNYRQLANPMLFNELLRYLIINLDFKLNEVHIMTINRKVQVCDQNFKPLPVHDENIIHTLIDAAPRQIFIHNSPEINSKLITEIEQFFPNCVCIEYNAVL